MSKVCLLNYIPSLLDFPIQKRILILITVHHPLMMCNLQWYMKHWALLTSPCFTPSITQHNMMANLSLIHITNVPKHINRTALLLQLLQELKFQNHEYTKSKVWDKIGKSSSRFSLFSRVSCFQCNQYKRRAIQERPLVLFPSILSCEMDPASFCL